MNVLRTQYLVCDNYQSNISLELYHWKYEGSAHENCNINFKLNHKTSAVFHNLKNYDSYLTMQELGKFNLKINVIPNGLKKYMSFSVNNMLRFIDNFQFLSSSLDSLVKNLKT